MATRSGPPKVVVVLGFLLAFAVLALAVVLGVMVVRNADRPPADIPAPVVQPAVVPPILEPSEGAAPIEPAATRPPPFLPGPPGTPGLSPTARMFLFALSRAPIVPFAIVEDAIRFVRNDADTLIGRWLGKEEDASRARALLAPIVEPRAEPEPREEPSSRLFQAYQRSEYAEADDAMGFYAAELGIDLEGRAGAIEVREVNRRGDGLGGCTVVLEATAPQPVRAYGTVFALSEDGDVLDSWPVFERIGPEGRIIEAMFINASCRRIASWRAQW